MSNKDKTTEPDPLAEILALARSTDARLTSVENRLEALETKVDERLRETRPIWEAVLQRLEQLEERFEQFNDKLEILVERDIEQAGDIRRLKKRLDNLEINPNSPTDRIK